MNYFELNNLYPSIYEQEPNRIDREIPKPGPSKVKVKKGKQVKKSRKKNRRKSK